MCSNLQNKNPGTLDVLKTEGLQISRSFEREIEVLTLRLETGKYELQDLAANLKRIAEEILVNKSDLNAKENLTTDFFWHHFWYQLGFHRKPQTLVDLNARVKFLSERVDAIILSLQNNLEEDTVTTDELKEAKKTLDLIQQTMQKLNAIKTDLLSPAI